MANTMDKLRELAEWVSNCAEHGDGCLAWAAQGSEHDCPCGLKEARELAKDILRESEAQGDAGAVDAKAWLLDVMGTWDFTMPTGAFDKIVNRIAASATPRAEPAEGRGAVGADDSITLTDVASVLGEIAEGFDGGEYAITDETRRVLIDFAHGIPEHPLFNAVGHYFAQNPVPGTTPPAVASVRVTDEDAAPKHAIRALDLSLAELRDLIELADDLLLEDQTVAALETAIESMEQRRAAFAAREGDGVRVTDEDARAVQRLVDRIDLDFVPGTYGDLGAAIEAAEPALRRIAAFAARDAQGDSHE